MTTKRLLAIAALVALFVAYVVTSGDSGTTFSDQADQGIAVDQSIAADQSSAVDQGSAETTAVLQDVDGGVVQESDDADAVKFSNLPSITIFELPLEALDTLDLIDQGGPYPFDRDDLVFQNREGLLPDRERGHYREYTVITPGENDRGARRIVSGADGERYYTADHYSSFSEVVFG